MGARERWGGGGGRALYRRPGIPGRGDAWWAGAAGGGRVRPRLAPAAAALDLRQIGRAHV